MATTLGPVPRFADENSTRHSFSLPPPPPLSSLDTSSMKSRKSFLSLFTPTRRFTSAKAIPRSGSQLKLVSKPTETATTTKSNDVGNRADSSKPLVERKPDPPEVPSKDLPRSKSHTLLRVISTTFRTRPPAQAASPPPVSPTAKQNREAALRERGLLPPLAPPKDLSRQEADQDRRTPVVRLEPKAADIPDGPSAADLIKREWESKNQSKDSKPSTENEERERMKSFRFGTPPSPATEVPATRDPVAPAKVDSDPNPPQPLIQNSPPGPSSHQSSGSSDATLLEAASIPLPISRPSSISSPILSATDGRRSSSISSANSPPLSSVHFGEIQLPSSSSGHSRSGSRRSFTSALSPGLHSLQVGVPGESSYPSLNISIPPRRSESLTQLHSIAESASPLTPSLDSSSRTVTTISTLNTVESPSAVSCVAPGRAKGKMGMLKVKTSEHVANIPMIVESPVENMVAVKPELVSPPLSPNTASQPTLVVPQQPVLTRRARDPVVADQVTRRKSFNPFKRSQSVRPAEPNRSRDSKISALGKLRRVSSSFTKPRASCDSVSAAPSSKGKTFDVSHLPPSPRLPMRFQTAQNVVGPSGNGKTSVEQRLPTRKPVHPTLHSRGSILLEASTIQDEESRRMTEMAFLG